MTGGSERQIVSRLHGRRCGECGKLSVADGRCGLCGSERGEALTLSGNGTLISWTTIRIAPARYAAEAPYTVGLVELDEGLRVTARLEGEPERFTSRQRVSLAAIDPVRGPIFGGA